MFIVLLAVVLDLVQAAPCFCVAGADEASADPAGRTAAVQATWLPYLATGYDVFTHSYSLATTDTSETTAELALNAGVEGRSARNAKHRWRLKTEASLGTESYRERCEAEYRLQSGGDPARLRVSGALTGRQFRNSTVYALSSDVLEGSLDLRGIPGGGRRSCLELRSNLGVRTYATPSVLEIDHQDIGTGIYYLQGNGGSPRWSLGARYAGRTYPDSSEIDRDILGVDAGFDALELEGKYLSVHHRSDRRLAVDESVKPSAWSHWTDVNAAHPLGTGRLFADLQAEIWAYDQDLGVNFDSRRVSGDLGFGWGDILNAGWKLGLAGEVFASSETAESYRQLGLLAGLETFGRRLGGSVSVEFGRRLYERARDTGAADFTGDIASYTDFSYWKVWLNGGWTFDRRLSLDFMASYEPEHHTEADDDATLGYASLSLIWRP